ncbi:MMPL family protein [Anatilimnocola aggregata]|uniref:MMPL family protein n=1 Tax=Anatilimnocola aggregata TaxID=2528021 RepID=A0A517YJD5_9BACT|nr:MMPL family transporter [Anatilimnocola aggregata]QDU30340.1 MMPL family protein [Anatilimnocola aggregata]
MSPHAGQSAVSFVVDVLLRGRWAWLLLGIVLAAIAYPTSKQMKFDRSVERMFAADDPVLAPYERLKAQFGGNEVVLAVYPDPDLLNPDGQGLKRLGEVSNRLKAVDGVKDVLSLAEVNALLEKLTAAQNLGGIFNFGSKKPKWSGPALLNPDSKLAKNYLTLFEGYTHGPDQQTAALACMLEPAPPGEVLDARRRDQTIASLRAIVENLPAGLTGGVLAGEPVMVVEGFQLLEQDGKRLGQWSTMMLGVTIIICFFSLRWLVAPIAVVQWSLLVTQAILVWSQLQLTMVSSMLSAIVTVVGVATVVHLIVRCRELETSGLDRYTAFRQAMILLAIPIVGAIATDVGGFGSLWWASVGPVQDFGTMMVIGSILVIPAVALLVPAIALVQFPSWSIKDAAPPHQSRLDSWLHHMLTGMLRELRRRQISAAIVISVVGLVIALGAVRLDVETDFTRNFRSGSRVVMWYEFVETRLGGAGVWDVIIPAPPELDEPYLARVRKLEERLRAIEVPGTHGAPAEPGLTKVLSLVDVMDAAKDSQLLAILAPESRAEMLSANLPVFAAALRYQPEDKNLPGRMRIMLRAHERQPAQQKRALIEEVRRVTLEEFPPNANQRSTERAEVTGFFVLLTSLIESMLRDQWTTFALASGAIAAMLLVLFRSIKLMLIGLVPNALPIFLVMGLLGWLGLRINMGAAMIAAVSMGLSVDSSIHYLDAFLRARQRGLSVADALAEVQSSVGRAMLFSTLALIIGFSVLCTSEFVPTVYFGALVSLAMLGGLLGNLVVLPLLLGWFVRDEKIAETGGYGSTAPLGSTNAAGE